MDSPAQIDTMASLATNYSIATYDAKQLESSHTTLPSTSFHSRADSEVYSCALVLSILIVLAIAGNLAVVYAVFTSRTLRDSNSNWFIINLSITDLFSAIFVMTPALFILILDLNEVG